MGWRRAASVGRLRQEYLTLDADGDAAGAERLARRLVEQHPDDGATWFNLGLYAKARRDWPESARCNSRALALARRTQDEPAAMTSRTGTSKRSSRAFTVRIIGLPWKSVKAPRPISA